MGPRKFWVVLREDDLRLKRHAALGVALTEAKRLAGQEGKSFYVLTAKRVVKAAITVEPVEHIASTPDVQTL